MNRQARRALWVSFLASLLVGGACSDGREICDDGVDNNGDTLVDCDDPVCAPDPESDDNSCRFPEECSGGWDEDADGQTDCSDSDCAGEPECSEDGLGGMGGEEATGGTSSSGGSEAGGSDSGGAPSGGSDSGGSGGTSEGGLGGLGGDTSDTGGSDGSGGLGCTGCSGGSGGSGGSGETGGSGGEGEPVCPTWGALPETSYNYWGSLWASTDFTASTCQADGSGNDAIFTHMAQASGTLTVRGFTDVGNLDLSIRTVCHDPSSELDCAAEALSIEEVSATVTAGQLVFIVVSGATSADEGEMNLEVVLD